MADATCKTCPNLDAGFCHLSPPDDRHGSMPWPRCDDDDWCGKHPVRAAAYEEAVSLARLERLKAGPLASIFGTGFIDAAMGKQPDSSWSEGVEPECVTFHDANIRVGPHKFRCRCGALTQRTDPRAPERCTPPPKPQYEHDLERKAVERTADVAGLHPATAGVTPRVFGHAGGVFFASGDLVWHKNWDKDTGAVRIVNIIGDTALIGTEPKEEHPLRDLKLARRGDLGRQLAP